MDITLNDLSIGEKCIVLDLSTDNLAIRRRLLDMGITKNAEITLQKIAPLGDPIEIKVRGYSLSIRKSEAKEVYVEKI